MLSGHISEVSVSRGSVEEGLVEGAGHMITLTLQSVCGCVRSGVGVFINSQFTSGRR